MGYLTYYLSLIKCFLAICYFDLSPRINSPFTEKECFMGVITYGSGKFELTVRWRLALPSSKWLIMIAMIIMQ